MVGEKVRVAVGDEVQVLMPHAEVCVHLRVADQVRTVRVLADGAQILDAEGEDYSFPVTHAEAGVRRDDEGLWVEPLPEQMRQVFRDGLPVSPHLRDDNAAMSWLLRAVPYSTDHALNHEGYEVRTVPPWSRVSLPTSYEQYAELVRTVFGDPHHASLALPDCERYAEWGYRYWTEVLGYYPLSREYACTYCGKPNGH